MCYSLAHGRKRLVVERTIELLKGRWRCLDASGGKVFNKPEKVTHIILTCGVHNIALRHGIEMDPEIRMDPQEPPNPTPNGAPAPADAVRRGQLIQRLLVGPDNVSCHDSLLRSDRLMLLFQLYQDQQQIWTTSNCAYCLSEDSHSLSNVTLYYMAILNQSLSCFEKHQEGNHSILCKECKTAYRGLNELYGRMEKNHSLCLDIEYLMSTTRRLWSKTFSCSFPRAETVPVIAVSIFMLFLPVIFYLSSFLHSEQKKRKLIQPKRAILHSNLINTQDRSS